MFEAIKKQLYFMKADLLFYKGLLNKKIVQFDDEFYEKMSHTYFNGIPISMHIKYLKPLPGMPGGCFDRSLFMFFCFPNAILCRGDIKDIELKGGKENAGHGWIEIDNYVYDPTLLERFDKGLYYSIYMPSNIVRYTKEDYCSTPQQKAYYDGITQTTIADLQKEGKKRMSLTTTMPLIRGIAEHSGNQDFIRELNEHLLLIKYDEQHLTKKLDYI